ncbi:MAG TPA: NAD(P)H-binding protein [Candidatus Nanopelagicales bacterium]
MILVCGATGDLGGRIARLLVEAGEPCLALVRPGTDASGLEDAGIAVVRGDLREPESLGPALAGIDTVVTTANANRAALDTTGNQSLVSAAGRAGVRRFVFVSAAGMGQEMARTGPLMAGKWRTEQALRASPMQAVLVRPDMFQEAWLGAPMFDPVSRTAMVVGSGQSAHRYVAIDDVAALCAHVAVAPDPGEVLEFGGPEPLTQRQVVAAYEDATGRAFRVRRVPRAALRVAHLALARVKPDIGLGLALSAFMDAHPATWDDAALRDAGVAPRAPRAFIEQAAAVAA